MSKAQEIIEELDQLEEASPNYTKLNAMINQIAMSRDTGKGKGDDPKFKKDAQSLLKKMTDDEELSPNDMKKLAGRLSKAMGESFDEAESSDEDRKKAEEELPDLLKLLKRKSLGDLRTRDIYKEMLKVSKKGMTDKEVKKTLQVLDMYRGK